MQVLAILSDRDRIVQYMAYEMKMLIGKGKLLLESRVLNFYTRQTLNILVLLFLLVLFMGTH